eukprot:scaffold108781_cov56-Phaeocystis_antarctica.AAC.1
MLAGGRARDARLPRRPREEEMGPAGSPQNKNPPPTTTSLSPGKRGAATERGALGWYRPSVGVPRDVGCRALVVYAANSFSVQFSCFSGQAQAQGSSSALLVVGQMACPSRLSCTCTAPPRCSAFVGDGYEVLEASDE